MEKAPLELTFVDPATVINDLPISNGQKVADFGCGSGYFTFEFAKKVGSEGQVYALDVLPSALEAVSSRAKILGLQNVATKRVNLEKEGGSSLAPQSVDWVVMKDILLQNKDKAVILDEAVSILKPGGYLLVMEWNTDEGMVGPEKELRIAPEELRKLIEEAGLSIERPLEVGGFHYAFLAKA